MVARIAASAVLLVAAVLIPYQGTWRFCAVPRPPISSSAGTCCGRPPGTSPMARCSTRTSSWPWPRWAPSAPAFGEGIPRGRVRHAVLPGGRAVPELRRGQVPEVHRQPDGHPAGLRQRGAGRPARSRWTRRRWRWATSSSSRPASASPWTAWCWRAPPSLDTAALTGESLPREVQPGDDVISGCVNLSGLLRVRVTKAFGESTVAKILDLVENSSSKKAKAENFITKFARYYTPAVVFAAVALAVLPPLFMGPTGSDWVQRALNFLVVSCPCALVISVPLELLRGHRRGLPTRHPGQGRQLSGGAGQTRKSWSLTRPAP